MFHRTSRKFIPYFSGVISVMRSANFLVAIRISATWRGDRRLESLNTQIAVLRCRSQRKRNCSRSIVYGGDSLLVNGPSRCQLRSRCDFDFRSQGANFKFSENNKCSTGEQHTLVRRKFMTVKNPKELFVMLLSDARQSTERSTKFYQEISQAAQDPDVKEALESRAWIAEKDLGAIDRCFELIGEQPVKLSGRLQE